MRTLIQGGWVIGYAAGGHRLYRDGVVVIEDDLILSVGRGYDGPADRTIDAREQIVSPGFIDAHVHSGLRLGHRLIQDAGRQDFFGQPMTHYTMARAGTTIPYEAEELSARYTIAELLRNGTTTFLELGGLYFKPTGEMQSGLDQQVEATGRLGLRGYLGPGFQSARRVADSEGRLNFVWDEAHGREELAAAREWLLRNDGRFDGRVRGLIAPEGMDDVSLELYRETRALANELHLPITTHAAYNVIEFQQTVLRYRMTPIEVLHAAGLLGPDLVIGHCNFVAENRLTNYAGGRDLELLAESGATVSHCPINLMRRGRSLDNWDRYRKAGVRMALGTDTWPRDMIMQMRSASYMAKVLTGSYLAAPASDVFTAATVGGADALGRPDLGRLAPGAKADVLIINTPGLRWGAVHDPVKHLVDCGIGDDVDTVM
ncbi:MAG TPA: chlorohydrolase family protein, partial [Chloroflexota bacterium]